MPALEYVAVIFNPAANRGRTADVRDELGLRLRAAGLRPTFFATSYVGDASRIARELAQQTEYSAVVAAGGDGTINEVANGLVGTAMPMGLLPLGTGNDFVKMFDLYSLAYAIERLASGETCTIDVGFVNGRAFVNGVGVGLDAQIAIEAGSIKRLKGIWVYIVALLKTLHGFKAPELLIMLDDQQPLTGRWSLVTVGNGGCHGGGFWLTPDAKVNDQRFDVCTAEAMSTTRMLKTFPLVLKGAHTGVAGVRILHTTRVSIEAPEGAAVHVDGEIIGEKVQHLAISMQPAALVLRV